jgi:NitT/TauT family transport system permease protein
MAVAVKSVKDKIKIIFRWILLLGGLILSFFFILKILSFIPSEAENLPKYALFSLGRVAAAYLLSLIFALSMGFAAASRKWAEKILLPTIDILQSIPVVGFFPVAIAFFIALFKGQRIGVEFAAIFLIFTSQAWNMAFGVYESLITIPKDLRRATAAYGLKGWLAFKKFYLPTCIPSLVYNSMVSWANSWFFLMSSEIFAIGAKQYRLPGLGYFLWFSSEKGRLDLTLTALAVLLFLILLLDFIFWRPLTAWSKKFSYQMLPQGATRQESYLLSKIKDILIYFKIDIFWQKILFKLSEISFFLKSKLKISSPFLEETKSLLKKVLLIIALAIFFFACFKVLPYFPRLLEKPFPKEASLIPFALMTSFLRILFTYLICLSVALSLSIFISLKEERARFVLPLAQILASLPGTALYPLLLAIILQNNIPFGLEIVSFAVIFTTSLWYIFFPVVGQMRSIPREVKESVLSISNSKWFFIRKVLIPGAFPAIVTGSIAAWGGAWNALVVSEYGIFNKKTYKVFGIGSLLDIATYERGDSLFIFLCLFSLVLAIILLNRSFWQKLYRLAAKRFSMEVD